MPLLSPCSIRPDSILHNYNITLHIMLFKASRPQHLFSGQTFLPKRLLQVCTLTITSNCYFLLHLPIRFFFSDSRGQHINLLVDCHYWDQALASQWMKGTSTSFEVNSTLDEFQPLSHARHSSRRTRQLVINVTTLLTKKGK